MRILFGGLPPYQRLRGMQLVSEDRPEEARESPPKLRNLARELLVGSGIYTVGILVGRLLGAYRDILMQKRFGPSIEQDAFLLAESIPRQASAQLTDLERSATVPMLGALLAEGQEDRAWRIQTWAIAVVGLALVLGGGVVAAFPRPFAALLVPHTYGEAETDLVARLLGTLILTLIIEGVAGLATAGWLARGNYALPGLAHIVPNAVVVSVLIYGGASITIEQYARGEVAGGAGFALVVLVPFLVATRVLRRLGGPPPWADLVHILKFAAPLTIPAVLGPLTVSVQRAYTGSLEEGVLSCYRVAQVTVQGPLGTIVAAMSTVLLPILARQAARGRRGYRGRVQEVLRLVLLIATPAVVLTAVYAPVLVGLLFERGAFAHADTLVTSAIVRVLVWQMLLAAASGVYAQAYLAIEDSRMVSFVRVVGYLGSTAVYVLLFHTLGLSAILAGELLAPALSLGLLMAWAPRRLTGDPPSPAGRFAIALVVANAAMALVALGLVRLWPAPGPPASLPATGSWLFAQALVGVVAYLLLARLLMPGEWHSLSARVRRR